MEQQIKKDIYSNVDDKQVLHKAQTFGIKHILEAKECVIPYRTETDMYIFLSFKKPGDSGYMFMRILNPERNFHEIMMVIHGFLKKMNLKDVEAHTPAQNIN